MRTAEAITPMPGLVVPFVLFTLLYVGLAITVVFLLWRQILKTGVHGGGSLGLTGEMPIPTPQPPVVQFMPLPQRAR